MARIPNTPLPTDLHTKALRVARELGREEAARRFGIGTATLERALAFARVSPLVRRAIESGVHSTASQSEAVAAL